MGIESARREADQEGMAHLITVLLAALLAVADTVAVIAGS